MRIKSVELIVFIMILASSCKSNSNQNKIIKIDTLQCFENDNTQFTIPIDIDVENENIYITDLGTSQINVYNMNMDLKNTIGREGKGPLEFNCITSITFSNDGLFFLVSDIGNQRIQKISNEGLLIKMYHYSSPFLSVDIKNNIYCISQSQTETILDVYDSDFNLISTMIPKINATPFLKYYALNVPYICTTEENIIVGFPYREQGILYKYSLDGSLQKEIYHTKSFKLNLPIYNYVTGNIQDPIFSAIKTYSEKLFVLYNMNQGIEMRSGNYIEIFELSGDFIGEIYLDHYISTFCFDKNGFMYGVGDDVVYKYEVLFE